MATVQEILNAAYGKSLKNQPGDIATEAVELLDVVNRALAALYSIGAHVNPTFFGKTDTMAGPPYPKPPDAEVIYRIETAGGSEVLVVPVDEQDVEPDDFALVSVGRNFVQGNVPNPATGTLTVYYSRKPAAAAALADPLDASWDEGHNELLILEVALYLAIKDGRPDEFPGLIAQRDRELARFVAHLEHELANIRSRWGHTRAITTARNFAPRELLQTPIG